MPLMNSFGNAQVFREATAPSSAQTGDVFIDTDNGQVFTYDGSNWIQQTGGAYGTARQFLGVNSNTNGLAFFASPQSLMTAQGDILYASSANTPARLAKGTASQVLKMNSGATAPEWGGAGGLSLIETVTLGSAAATISSGTISPTYDFYLVQYELIASGNIGLAWRFNGDSGTTYDSEWVLSDTYGSNAGGTQIYFTGTASTSNIAGFAFINNGAAGRIKTLRGMSAYSNGTINHGGGRWNNTAALISSITITDGGESGSFDTGSQMSIYGFSV